MKISREWATPLTMGAFALMAVTGMLMFFHLDRGLNKTAHEWLGWLMVAAVGVHATVNWAGFKRYFGEGTLARPILAVSLLVIAGSFVQLRGEGGRPPPFLAMQAVLDSPLSQVAPLTGKPAEQLLDELKAAGIPMRDVGQTLAQATGRDREREGRALTVLFSPRMATGGPK